MVAVFTAVFYLRFTLKNAKFQQVCLKKLIEYVIPGNEIKVLMTFEKQICDKCKKLAYCVDTRSIGCKNKPKLIWLCEFCYASNTIEFARTKDSIRSIMIQCGIEDLDVQGNNSQSH